MSAIPAVVLVRQQIHTNAAAADSSEGALGGTRPALVRQEAAHVEACLVAKNVGAARRVLGEREEQGAVVVGSRAWAEVELE